MFSNMGQGSTGVIEYIKEIDGQIIFTTHPLEKEKLIFQIGTACPELALKAALTVASDVKEINVNAGCPKPFSLQGGMGAALLKKPDLLCKILETLVSFSGKPVSVKIRILESLDDTLTLIQRLQNTGIVSLAVHCRTAHERPKDKAHWEIFKEIVPIMKIPLIANGDLLSFESMRAFIKETNITKLLLARGAEANPSIFSVRHHHQALMPLHKVAKAYLEKAIQVQNGFPNTKYTLMHLNWESYKNEDYLKMHQLILHSKSYEDLKYLLGSFITNGQSLCISYNTCMRSTLSKKIQRSFWVQQYNK